MLTNEIKMNCKEFKRVSVLFIDNEISDDLKTSADIHLVNCNSCNSYFQNLNQIYSEAENLVKGKKTDQFFYTRLRARLDIDLSLSKKGFRQISYYLQPAFYILIGFTLLLSVLVISGNKNSKQLVTPSISIQTNNSEEQDYLKTIAMNEQTFEEDYINIIEK